MHYLWSVDLSKSFSQFNMSIFIFSQYFQYILPSGEVWRYPTLLINFIKSDPGHRCLIQQQRKKYNFCQSVQKQR